MTTLELQMLSELSEAQNFVYELSENLNTQGVAASYTEGLDTLVPKVLEIESGVGTDPLPNIVNVTHPKRPIKFQK